MMMKKRRRGSENKPKEQEIVFEQLEGKKRFPLSQSLSKMKMHDFCASSPLVASFQNLYFSRREITRRDYKTAVDTLQERME